MTATVAVTEMAFELGCSDMCDEMAGPLYEQLSSGRYDRCSTLMIPESVEAWEAAHRTARKRAWRAERLGYWADVLFREFWADDIFRINTSLGSRQGRPMADGYLERHEFSSLPVYSCGRHAIRATGVWASDNRLVAYLVMHRAGDLALVSQILGHGDHLDDGIMYLLFREALEREIGHGPGVVVYNRHDSGTDGLRFYKERCGFEESRVEWLP